MEFLKYFRVSLFFAAVLIAVSSCKTPSELALVEARPISTNKLLKRVEQNSFDYDYLTIKRVNCNFSSSQSKATFKINLKAKKDDRILVSISKLNIPVGRVLLTPDSVKYVNYIDRNYFVDDYSYLSSFLHIDLDFATIQSIISNNAFSYRNDPKNKDYRTFDSFIEDNLYVLQSEKSRKIEKMEEKENKAERRLRRLDDQALIVQKMFFNPDNFALKRLSISDKTNKRNMKLLFDDFTEVENKAYPGSIEMNFHSPEEEIEMKIRMNGFSTDKITSFNIKIPQKYEEIRVN
ncbi:DUF4292 domain-containing protein [Draconibacterium halophilum]|uniref:DUF4292 domain-containing protein n=1 Tax=Draconibacterium halophilum TaxID=2706887 RepID=A0A6C0RBH2_9BACT|nr:DUF4292 domain-containing protein [Draconibacterium halophilum]QIA06521.1 DUF4292 domain-containing protein [Draconibacterium halophilum]